ncbi:unnamed protein product [Coregonus sp. 'balchen']|nr:unnamed protein product [Coregonus sp. 'balchen']
MATLSVGEPQEMEVDRKGESEESGDDETRRKSINGEVDPNQPPATVKEESPVDMDTITLDPEEEDVDLVHCRIGKIEGLEVLRKAKTLSLRQNLIKNIENLETLVTLKELDLYDNQIRKLENLQTLTELDQLDVSFNLLRKITQFQHLEGLHNLTVLSIQSNRITKMEGLQGLVNLKELYLSHNGIEVIEGLENNKKLTTLDIAANRVKKIENISHLTDLQEFWNAKALETVYLERNPLQKDPQYRRKIMLALPTVRQIDATFIRF